MAFTGQRYELQSEVIFILNWDGWEGEPQPPEDTLCGFREASLESGGKLPRFQPCLHGGLEFGAFFL